jgi:2-haloacid dehalogenase
MARRPLVIAFDVIETLFPLEPIRQRLIAEGQPGHLLEQWFARLLRDAFAVVASGGYRPFGEFAAAALRSSVSTPLTDAQVQAILAGFTELAPHPDVVPAVGRLRDAGIRMVTLTNGSAANTSALLRRAGIDEDIEQVLSVDDIQRWKPAPEIYRHAATSTGVPPDRLALVAAHAWDTHGAHEAGLVTGWISRLEDEYPRVFAPPDVTGPDLGTVVDGLLGLPA